MKNRSFTLADQLAFAELSGDNNPIHVDPVVARRSMFGRPIVHGIHSLLWALDQYLEGRPGPVRLQSLHASFLKPIGLNQEVRFNAIPGQNNRVRLDLFRDGEMAVRMVFELAAATSKQTDVSSDLPTLNPPDEVGKEAIRACAGSLDLHLPLEPPRRLFPNLTGCLCPVQTAVLLATTRLVGVKCPGLHSIYSELKLAASETGDLRKLNYLVAEFDDRYGLVLINVIAPGITGTIKAFVRPQPQVQTSFLVLKNMVESQAFAGQNALILGGSRGLGEVAAKLLASGGARVQLTYHLGKADAQAVADEINAGGGQAGICELNILQPQPDWKNLGAPTELYYFASPHISGSSNQSLSPALFHHFCDYFVSGFASIVEALQKTGLRHAYYPSTVFVDELPANFMEYALAKIAGEALCRALEKKHPGMRACFFRLPRMATDQTISLQPAQNPDPAPIILETLRSFQAVIDSNREKSSNSQT